MSDKYELIKRLYNSGEIDEEEYKDRLAEIAEIEIGLQEDETNEDETNEDVTNEDVTNEDVTNEDVTNEDVTNEPK